MKTMPKPMRSNAIYVATWDSFIKDVIEHPNFKDSYLLFLDKLCQLFVEVDEIDKTIEIDGRTFCSDGRNGSQIKNHPLIGQKNMCHKDIIAYAKLIGLGLKKDSLLGAAKADEPEWD